MSLSRKQVSILCIIIAVVILAVALGCVFGIKCTVTLKFRRFVRVYAYEFSLADSSKDIKTRRFASFLPPLNIRDKESNDRLVGWYKDSSCTVPWLTTDKVTSNLVLFAKWKPAD